MKQSYFDQPPKYSSEKSAKIVILPVPYDGTSTWIKGAGHGPEAMLEASCQVELYDRETDSEVYRHGIFSAPPVLENKSPENVSQAVYNKTKAIVGKGQFPVILGGEHSVSIGAIRAMAEKYPQLTVLQLDAHADLRESYEGSTHNHACVMARAREQARVVQVGIRSFSREELPAMQSIFFAEDIHNNHNWHKDVIKALSGPVYITIDLDVFDPSLMPSTGTPEPGGLLWYDVLKLLRGLTKKADVKGFDVVELCPNPANKAPDFMAAKLIYKTLSYCFE
jgi:agmatinase